MCLYPLFGVKVPPPRVFAALLEGNITCGRCTFAPVSVVKVHLLKAPLLGTTLVNTTKDDLRSGFVGTPSPPSELDEKNLQSAISGAND